METTWRQSPAGQRFLEAAVVARLLEALVEGMPALPTPAASNATHLVRTVEEVWHARSAELDGIVEDARLRAAVDGGSITSLAVAASRSIYLIAAGKAASRLLRAFLDAHKAEERDVDYPIWSALALGGREPTRREQKSWAAECDARTRAAFERSQSYWSSPQLPEPVCPPPSGPSGRRDHFLVSIEQSLEGRVLSHAMSWRKGVHDLELLDDATQCEIDKWASRSTLWMVTASLETLTGRSFEARLDHARSRVVTLMLAGEPVTPYVDPPEPGETVIAPLG